MAKVARIWTVIHYLLIVALLGTLAGWWEFARREDMAHQQHLTAHAIELAAERATANAYASALRLTAEEVVILVAATEEQGRVVDRITFASGPVERLTGYTAEQLEGQSIATLIPDSMRPQHDQAFSAAVKRHAKMGAQIVRCNLLRQDRTTVPVQITTTSTPTKDGLLLESMIRDLTQVQQVDLLERSEIHLQLEQLREMVAEALDNPRSIQQVTVEQRSELSALFQRELEKLNNEQPMAERPDADPQTAGARRDNDS